MNPENLTAEQEKEILDFWGKYQNLFPIKTIFHSFYLEKTGRYDFRFMPADIHFCYVDTFYNNWTRPATPSKKISLCKRLSASTL